MDPIAAKTNKVLQIICIAFLIIASRVLHLGVVQRDEKLKEAAKPKIRTQSIRAPRGEIYDRFHIPLAKNQICYHAAIDYSQIQQIASRSWTTNEAGERVKIFPRREHIQKISSLLSDVLGLDEERVEDLIHAKASILPHVPFVIKNHLTEAEYYRLKMLEKDFPGIRAEISSERVYPREKSGSHLIGHLGSISQREYRAVVEEILSLQEVMETLAPLPSPYQTVEEVATRLETLKNKAYSLNDQVGKSGIEKQYEERLRGFSGIKVLEVDNQGKPLRELPESRDPIAGSAINLSISIELQEFAEELLIKNERERDGRNLALDPKDKVKKQQPQPWIKGGAIVALSPMTGEVLAIASYPRFDPNDFVRGGAERTSRWVENEQRIGDLWNGNASLEREKWNLLSKKVEKETQILSWEFFLEQILTKQSPLFSFFEKIDDIKGAVQIQEDFIALLYFSKTRSPLELMEALTLKQGAIFDSLKNLPESAPYLRRIEAQMGGIIESKDRLFALDLFRLSIYSPRFSDELLAKIGAMKIATYRLLNQSFCRLLKEKKEEISKTFHKTLFADWKNEHKKEFLKQKRIEEKEKKRYAKPYLDYLDQKEKELFTAYWEENKIALFLEAPPPADHEEPLYKTLSLLSRELKEEFLRTFRFFEELDLPLLTPHKKWSIERDLASAFYPVGGFGYTRSYAFQTESPQGSLFKLVTAYEGLKEGCALRLIDKQALAPSGKGLIVAYTLDEVPYRRIYKKGRLPKSVSSHIGEIDLIGALEHSSNPYFAILAGDYFSSPENLNQAASLFGYGTKTGIDLPGEKKGKLPIDLKQNITGLYSYAIGQHTLLSTPLQSATMLATLANGGYLQVPQLVKEIHDPFIEEEAVLPKTRATIPLPASIRNPLFEGIDRCVSSPKGSARPSAIKSLLSNPLLMRDYLALQHQMIGKTGTAEILYNPAKYPSSSPQMYTHIWFGAIGFPQEMKMSAKTKWENPEIVVVVFLPFGDSGKEAAPLAAQVIHKWREISKAHHNK